MRASRLATVTLSLMLVAGLVLAWLTRDMPLVPVRGGMVLRADALSALLLIVAAAHALAGLALGVPRPWLVTLRAALVGLAAVSGHLAAIGGVLLVAGLVPGATAGLAAGRLRGWVTAPWLAPLLATGGLALIGLIGGEWHYAAPAAGSGLNSLSFGLLLFAALLALGVVALPGAQPPAGEPLIAAGCLYALLRLFSLGPWNPGWLLATLLVGGVTALWAAGRAVAVAPARAAPWLGLALGGLVLAGAGLGSGAGLTAAGYVLLLGPVLRLGLERPADGCRALWLLSAAVPLSGPFVAGWLAVAAAAAGGVSVLAVALWLAALLAALPPARLARAAATPEAGMLSAEVWSAGRRAWLAAGLSATLGLGAPLVLLGLLGPLVAQLQGGLTPFGEIVLWPWVGLIARNAGQQPVATLPSLALAGLMLILTALCWLALRLVALHREE